MSEATFCGNALLAISGSTPYNAVYGRVPAILPSVDQLVHPDENRLPAPGLISGTHRLREIAVQAMVEGTPKARLSRSKNGRTTISAETLNLKTGEEVDIFRKPTTKDASGWHGPAIVVDVNSAKRGVVSVRFHNKISEVALADIRRHLTLFTFLQDTQISSVHTNVFQFIKDSIERLPIRSYKQFGQVLQGSKWKTSTSNKQIPGVHEALKCFRRKPLALRQCGLGEDRKGESGNPFDQRLHAVCHCHVDTRPR